ncbi:MAG: VOC family protein [Haloarculaceae archaeon]
MTDTSTAGELPAETRVGRSALQVADLESVTAFYRDVVGLRVLDRSAGTATLGAGGTALLLLEADEDAGARTGPGLYHNAIRVPSRGALGDVLGRVRDGWTLGGASDHRVSEALYFADPEGNGVEVYRDFPRESWPATEDGRAGMATDPLDRSAVEAAAAGEDRVPAGTDLGHVHLEVSSLGAAREFYVDALGFVLRDTYPGAVFVAAGGYHHHVGANVWNERTGPAEGRGLSWFEVVVPEEGFDAVRERLAEEGYTPTETDDGIAVTDPDGLEVRVRAE